MQALVWFVDNWQSLRNHLTYQQTRNCEISQSCGVFQNCGISQSCGISQICVKLLGRGIYQSRMIARIAKYTIFIKLEAESFSKTHALRLLLQKRDRRKSEGTTKSADIVRCKRTHQFSYCDEPSEGAIHYQLVQAINFEGICSHSQLSIYERKFLGMVLTMTHYIPHLRLTR